MLPLHVKIDVTKVRYPVIKEALEKLCCEETHDDPQAVIVWWDGFIPTEQFQHLLPHQRINKIPAMDTMCYKNTFFQSLSHMKNMFPSFYCFFPMTFQLPFQFSDFQREHMRLTSKGSTVTWILKPKSGCCGNGIKLIQNAFELADQGKQAIIQRYVSPYLLDGYKFDFRLYILIATLQPFTVYIYNEGLTRFCSERYVAPARHNLHDKFCHLTNTAVNVGNTDNEHSILELSSRVMKRIAEQDERGKTLWNRIRQVVLLSVIALYPNIIQNVTMHTPIVRKEGSKALDEMHKYFHILGIDIMLNDRCEPIVLELNDRPSMCVTYDIERTLKSRLVYDALNIISVNGAPPDKRAKPGGWQKIMPADESTPFGKAAKGILEKSCQGQTGKKVLSKRLGYTPLSTKPTRWRQSALPKLHQ